MKIYYKIICWLLQSLPILDPSSSVPEPAYLQQVGNCGVASSGALCCWILISYGLGSMYAIEIQQIAEPRHYV